MDYRSFLVHVEAGNAASDARLELAAYLAKRFNARLVGVAACAVQPLPVADIYGPALSAEYLDVEAGQLEADLNAAREFFETHPACKGLSTAWRSAVDMPAKLIAREARIADVVIVGRDLERIRKGPHQSADPGDVLMQAGRPVLVVPPGTGTLEAKHVLVAWKDTREARRAVRDALPLLRKAHVVHVVEVTDEDDLSSAAMRIDEVVSYLACHDVNAEAEARTPREKSTADELILVAEQAGADLIVAGGYGHARLMEWMFGGVTGNLLRSSPKCCLFAH